MKIDLRGPCSNCPFRTDIPPYIRLERYREIVRAITEVGDNFVCHKTITPGSGRRDRRLPERAQHCGGALVFMAKQGYWNRAMRMAVALDILKIEELQIDAPIYGSLEEIEARLAEEGS